MFAKTALISFFLGRNQETIAETTARGATHVATPKVLAQAIDIVTLCVTTSEVVESLIYGDDGILAGFNEGAVVIDYGTSIPALTQKVGADLATKSAGMIDAPLGCTPTHAKGARLNTMAVGEIETFETVKPVLDVQGKNFFDLGALDAGQTTKLINNFMGMTTACTMSQVFAVVQKKGR